MITLMFTVLGSLLGCFLGFTLSKHTKPFRDLQRKLSAKEAEYARYQDHVAEHFRKTADLFSEIQVRQDILVAHLQEGAKQLRGEMLGTTHDAVAITSHNPECPRDYPLQIEA